MRAWTSIVHRGQRFILNIGTVIGRQRNFEWHSLHALFMDTMIADPYEPASGSGSSAIITCHGYRP